MTDDFWDAISDVRQRIDEALLIESAKLAPQFETYAQNMLKMQFYAINKLRESKGLPPLQIPSLLASSSHRCMQGRH